MGLFSFLKSAGEKLFGVVSPEEKAEKITQHLAKYGFNNINVAVEDETVSLSGSVDSLEEKNKILVAAGNVEGIAHVNDMITVKKAEIEIPEIEVEKMFYTVKKGDYLSKIAKKVYGDASKYPIIFEANKPMLKDPDLIYPGQVLVIPQD